MTGARFRFSPWRHGGWYVENVRYASGACGCVSRDYPDGRWRIVCHPLGDAGPTFATREAAAAAELELADASKVGTPWRVETPHGDGWAACGWIPPFATEGEALAAIDREGQRATPADKARQLRAVNMLARA